ncbi:MAG TPA: DegT/DnrJ/EryC1/StrS family aminotransferase [Abditibacterium sp.]
MVPLFDLTRQYQNLKTDLDAAVLGVLASGQYVMGPAVEDFEAMAARELGVKHAIGVANGTDALQIALRALKIGPGDEVITTPFSFYSAAEVIADLGATPVFVDVESDTLNIDPQLVEAAITPRTRALIPVHIFGHPAAMDELNAIAQKHGLAVIEDSAQGWGAALNGKMCGSLAQAATFSFFPSKNLGACGEGGLISTDDDEIAQISRCLRVHGQSRRYFYDEIGYNSRLHAMQAAILQIKLPHAQSWNDSRRKHAAHYAQLLQNTPYILPVEREGARHIYHQYTLRLPQGLDRDKICAHLSEKNIGWAIYYPLPLHLQPVFADLGFKEGQMPISEAASREVFSIPVFPELEEREVEEVGATLLSALEVV